MLKLFQKMHLIPREESETPTIDFERAVRSCPDELVETISEDVGYKRLRFTNQNNTIFEFISYEWETQNQGYLSSTRLKGHCFPGVDGYLGCGKDNSFHWGKEVVKFFLEHPKKL